MKARKSNTTLKINTNIVNLIILFSCFTFFVFGCKTTSVETEPKPILVNLPALINKPPQEVEKIIGKPKEVYPIYKGYSDANPKIGEGRVYNLPTLGGSAVKVDDYTIRVDYYKGKSVFLYAYFPEQQTEPEEFARRCGFELNGKNPTEVFPENVRWNGNINGISFSEVILWRSPDSKDKFYACGCETKKIPR